MKAKRDAFGRFMTEEEGFMYMVIRGIPLVYCGWPKNFVPEVLDPVSFQLFRSRASEV
jgi:hypothetical protein